MSKYSSGSDTRDKYLEQAIKFVERMGDQPTLSRVALRLEGIAKIEEREPFALKQAELDGWLRNLHPSDEVSFDEDEQHSGDVPRDAVSGNAVVRKRVNRLIVASLPPESLGEVESAPPPQPTAAREVTRADALNAAQAANTELTEARLGVLRAQAGLRDLRTALAKSVEAWQSGNINKLTPEQNARNFVNAALEERKRRAAIYGSGTSQTANAFVRRQKQVPAGVDPAALKKGKSRGAHPSSMRVLDWNNQASRGLTQVGRDIADKMGVATQPK